MAIKNTSEKEARPEWLMGGNPSAIDAQEKSGQEELAASSQLPREGLDELAAEHGIEILGPSEGDDLFMNVRMPDGMKIEPTDHSMWSRLVATDGTELARIFYKAAFYDRRAFIRWTKAEE